MVTLANAMADNNLIVDLLIVRKEGAFLNLPSPKVRVIELKAKKTRYVFHSLWRYLKHHKPDVLLSALTEVNLAAILCARATFSTVKLIVSEHNIPSIDLRHNAPFARKVAYWSMRWLYRMADEIVAVSHGVACDVAAHCRIPVDRVRIIYNPVPANPIRLSAMELPTHPWFGRDEPPVILGVGRLTPQKDFATLIKAFATVRKSRRVRLVILGEGGERSALRELAVKLGVHDDVDLPGFQENPFPIMARAAVVVVASAWEGLSLVLIEAMACGTPVVSTNCFSGPAEVLDNGRFGPLVPVGNVFEMASAITKTIDKPLPPSVLQERAREFSVAKAYDRYMTLVQ
jgi:glycosyltransferase involved in cell wall biosynthesis